MSSPDHFLNSVCFLNSQVSIVLFLGTILLYLFVWLFVFLLCCLGLPPRFFHLRAGYRSLAQFTHNQTPVANCFTSAVCAERFHYIALGYIQYHQYLQGRGSPAVEWENHDAHPFNLRIVHNVHNFHNAPARLLRISRRV